MKRYIANRNMSMYPDDADRFIEMGQQAHREGIHLCELGDDQPPTVALLMVVGWIDDLADTVRRMGGGQ